MVSQKAKAQVKGEDELRRARLKRLALIFGIVVLLPTLAAVVYYGGIASRQYSSVTTLSLETGIARADSRKGAAAKDLELLASLLQSRAAYEAVMEAGFHDHVSNQDVDALSRLDTDDGDDAAYAFYREQLEIRSSSESAIDVYFFGFAPEPAQTMSRALISHVKAQLASERDKTRELLVAPALERVESAREAATGEGVEAEVAKRRLAGALREVELAQQEVLQREARLVVIAEPSLPDSATRPRRLWNIATIFFTTLALGALFLLLGDVVREHGQF